MDKVIMRGNRVLLLLAITLAACRETTAPGPSAPTDVIASLVTATSVKVTWSPRPRAEKVTSYGIYRNGLRVGETTATEFSDSALAENVTLAYSVSSIIDGGYESQQSTTASVTTRDATAPRIIQNFPANGAGPLNVENIVTTLVFSEAMDSSSINNTTFTLKVGPTGEPIPGSIAYFKNQHVAEFHSVHTMPPATTIVVTAVGMKDASGNVMASPYSFSFTTTENVRPYVVSIVPADGATEVPLNADVRITFSEPMNLGSLRTRIFDLSSNLPGDFVPATGSWDSATNTQILSGSYKSKHRYEVVVGWNFPATDLAGNTLTGQSTFFFTTLDAGPPFAVSLSPDRNATGVEPATQIRITFNEALDPSSINVSNFRVYKANGGDAVAGTVSYDAATYTAIFIPTVPLLSATQYGALLGNVKDATGIPQEDYINWLFTTR